MKVLMVSTSDKIGGAAIACTRIFNALRKSGVDISMLVRDKVSADPDIHTVNTSVFRKAVNFAAFCMERLRLLFALGFRRKNLFQVSLDNYGVYGLLDNPLVKESDIINIHWTSQGMLSLSHIQKLLDMGKRIIVTMHDMHHFTGICHYARTCSHFTHKCGNCPYLHGGHKELDLSRRWFAKKLGIAGGGKITFVACSRWLADIARTSDMMKDTTVIDIPNAINTDVFRPENRDMARKKFGITRKMVILFGAMNVSDERKGLRYLIEALNSIHERYPEYDEQIQLLVFGQSDRKILCNLPYHYTQAGYLNCDEDLVSAYSLADVYVTPSLEDNLPNTVMEAMSCGVPSVSFNVGGLPQLIDHKRNGYLANYKDSQDLADGIVYVLQNGGNGSLRCNARRKVEECFSEPVVAIKYRNAYRAL
ncbi:MAG: glycosyltransferase [Bacteroidales bacterium]|nr:glycosyltransferase [Bacteroidales bacterium]